jgi:hypothetical protein
MNRNLSVETPKSSKLYMNEMDIEMFAMVSKTQIRGEWSKRGASGGSEYGPNGMHFDTANCGPGRKATRRTCIVATDDRNWSPISSLHERILQER